MKRLLILIVLALGIGAAQAQIPAEVTDVMNRCRAAMTNPSGLEYEMDMKTGIGPLGMKMHFVVANKGNLNRTLLTFKVLGMNVTTETGFDGTHTWEIDRDSDGDTITFTPGDHRKESDGSLMLDLDKKYRKAKMKVKDGYYEITFKDPIDKDNEAKSVSVKIAEKNNTLREMHTSARGAGVTMNITKIRVGLKDSYFKLNLADYPNAVIIRK